MITEIGQIIVTTGELLFGPGIHAARVRHHTLPVVFGEGATTREAAEDLVRKLMRESSSVSGWHLKDLERSHRRYPRVSRPDRRALRCVDAEARDLWGLIRATST